MWDLVMLKAELVAELKPGGTMSRDSVDTRGGLRACEAVWQAD